MAVLANPVLIIAVGAVAATIAMVVFLARRSLESLIALAGIVAFTLIALLVERFVVTDREQIRTNLADTLQAIEANDLASVLAQIDSAAKTMRADASALMPQIKVEKARALGTVEVEVDRGPPKPTATCTFRAFLQGIHAKSGMQVAYFNQQVDIHWIWRDGRWLMDGYTAYYDGKPINAVQSAAGNRPVP